jgi:branched-chain amino acid transport system substrate-binding protein
MRGHRRPLLMRSLIAGSAVACSTVSLAACASSGADTTSGTTSGASAAGGSTGPVVVGVVSEQTGALAAPYLETWAAGAEAAAKYISTDLGGFGGRKIQLVQCDSQSTAAGALTCANEMVQDKATFVTGISLNFGADGIPILAKANIPVQMLPISTQDFTSPNSFPIIGGVATDFPAEVTYAEKQLKAHTIAFTAADSVPAETVMQEITADFKGGKSVDAIVPTGTADLSSTIAKITQDKTDVVLSSLSGALAVSLYQGLAAQGFGPSKIISQGSATDYANVLSKISPASLIKGADFCYEMIPYDDSANPDIALYQKEMKQFGTVSYRSEYAQEGFSVIMTDYNLAKKIGFDKFDSATMTKAFTTQTVPVFSGLPYDRADAGKQTPAIGVTGVKFAHWTGSELVADFNGWFYPSTGQISSH